MERVAVVEVFSAPFRPKVVQDKASEDVERLPCVSEIASVVRKEARSVVVELHGDFTQEHKGPSDFEFLVDLPFAPNALESLPRVLSHRAVE